MAEFLAGMSGKLTEEGKKYLKELQKLSDMTVAVGYFEGKAYKDGTSIVTVAAANEYGSSKTPARPFMKKSFEDNQPQLKKACDNVFNEITKGVSVKASLQKLGAFLKGLVQMTITEGEFVPNATSTIRKKRSNRPLIDTGFMRQNVDYKIRRK